MGACTCLMGRNGLGKTTLLKCIMALLRASPGEISSRGPDRRRLPAEERARLGIGYVPQGREIFAHLTVEENLRVGLGVRKAGMRSIQSHVFELFPLLMPLLNRRGGSISAGQPLPPATPPPLT